MTASARSIGQRLVLLIALAGTVGGCLSGGVASSEAPTAATSVLLSASDQAALGFQIHALPATAKAAQVSENDAVEKSAAFLGDDPAQVTKPDEVLHVMAAADASSPERSVFVVIWQGGDPVPGGPEGNGLHKVAYRGVVVDDQTGEVLRSFAAGTT
jgi:hypothetical protein